MEENTDPSLFVVATLVDFVSKFPHPVAAAWDLLEKVLPEPVSPALHPVCQLDLWTYATVHVLQQTFDSIFQLMCCQTEQKVGHSPGSAHSRLLHQAAQTAAVERLDNRASAVNQGLTNHQVVFLLPSSQ